MVQHHPPEVLPHGIDSKTVQDAPGIRRAGANWLYRYRPGVTWSCGFESHPVSGGGVAGHPYPSTSTPTWNSWEKHEEPIELDVYILSGGSLESHKTPMVLSGLWIFQMGLWWLPTSKFPFVFLFFFRSDGSRRSVGRRFKSSGSIWFHVNLSRCRFQSSLPMYFFMIFAARIRSMMINVQVRAPSPSQVL